MKCVVWRAWLIHLPPTHLSRSPPWTPDAQSQTPEKAQIEFPGHLQDSAHSWQSPGSRSHDSNLKLVSVSRVRLFVTPWTVAHQAPLSMGLSRQEYRSGQPFPSPGDIPDPWVEPESPILQADSLSSEPPGKRQSKPRHVTELQVSFDHHLRLLNIFWSFKGLKWKCSSPGTGSKSGINGSVVIRSINT